jgi:predicted nucleotidyltransferase
MKQVINHGKDGGLLNILLESLEVSKFCIIFAGGIEKIIMLVLQDCIQKLSNFKMMFAQKYGITKLGIFGSVARNEHSEQSDIDIVVEVKKPSLRLMYELKEALKQLFNCEVDLVRFRDSLRPLFKSNIQRVVIYV